MTTTTDAGRVAEAKVLSELTKMGWYPFVDISGKCSVDIIAWKDGVCRTIQVKATAYQPNKKYVVQIGSIRPNRTGNAIKKYDGSKFDYLAVYVSPLDKVYFIPSMTITAGRSLTIDDRYDGVILI